MSKVYITSDLHLNHKKAAEWRGFKDLETMNDHIVKRWNSVVSNSDTVYVIGDYAFGEDKEQWIEKLKGDIIFIKGNHDSNSLSIIKNLIINFQGTKFEMVHIPQETTKSCYFVLHGHIHKTGNREMPEGVIKLNKDYIYMTYGSLFYNVNCEFHKYKPKLINEIIGELKQATYRNDKNNYIYKSYKI